MLNDPVRLAFRPPGSFEEPKPLDGGPALDNDQAIPIPGGSLTFDDVLRGLNPLHHVPVVGMMYRAATGTEIHPLMRVAGAAVFGGPVGIALAGVQMAVEAFQPAQRFAAHLQGRPDPLMPSPASAEALPAPRSVAEAYRRWGEMGLPAPAALAAANGAPRPA